MLSLFSCMVWRCAPSTDLREAVQLSQHPLLKDCLPALYILASSAEDSLPIGVMLFFSKGSYCGPELLLSTQVFPLHSWKLRKNWDPAFIITLSGGLDQPTTLLWCFLVSGMRFPLEADLKSFLYTGASELRAACLSKICMKCSKRLWHAFLPSTEFNLRPINFREKGLTYHSYHTSTISLQPRVLPSHLQEAWEEFSCVGARGRESDHFLILFFSPCVFQELAFKIISMSLCCLRAACSSPQYLCVLSFPQVT